MKREIDLDRFQELFPNDPNALYSRAQEKISKADWVGALEVLSAQMAMGFPRLLVFRAIALARLDRNEEALDALRSAIEIIDEDDPDSTRLFIAETAINLGHLEIASSIVSGASETLPQVDYVRARLDLAKGDLETAKNSIEAAVSRYGEEIKTLLFSTLGRHYCERGDLDEALKAWEQSDFLDMPETDQQRYVDALLRRGHLTKADEIIKESFVSEKMPSWVLSAAVVIAQKSEDPSEAIKKLSQLIELETTPNPSARLELSRHLIDLDMGDDAEEHIEWLRQRISVLSPRQTMYLAQLMETVGMHSDSVDVALCAFRHGRTDPSIHRAFSTLCILNEQNNSRSSPLVIGANSYFCLRKTKGVSGGKQLAYYVFNDGPIDATRKEMSIESAKRMGYWGKKIGDEIIINKGAWNQEIWCVEEIKDAAMQLAVTAIGDYHESFPEENFFAVSIHFDPKSSPGDILETLVNSLSPKEESSRKVLKAYKEASSLPLPLGIVAELLNVSLNEAMIAICHSTKIAGPLRVEWSDPEGREESRTAAQQSPKVVLTRSALVTAQIINILDLLGDRYSLIAPHSLRQELRSEQARLQKNFAQGVTLMGIHEGQIYRTQYDAGHEYLRGQVENFQTLWSWVEQYVHFLALPLSKVFPVGSKEDVCRNSIGRSSMDAVGLSQAENIAMYADDLGLRHFFKKGDVGRSFSSVGLIRGWADLGVITPSDRDEMFLKMLMMNYDGVPISLSLIQLAFNRYPIVNKELLGYLLRVLFASLNLQSAAHISSAMLKNHRLTDKGSQNLGLLTSILLEAMANCWGMPLSSMELRLCMGIAFHLLPDDLKTIETVIEFVASETSVVR
jgi:tetratricopeptide (TPR) repeat protein